MTRARLAFNALSLWPGGSGVQTYIVELLGALVGEVDAEMVASVRAGAADLLPPAVTPIVRNPGHGVRALLTEARGLGPASLVHGLDVHIPARPGAPTVATVHDLAVYDVPWAFTRRWALRERAAIAHAARRADALVAVSSFTAERLRHRFGREATVVPEAPSRDMVPATASELADVRRTYELPGTFVLCVATIEPRKDVATLAAACGDAGVPLVIAGAPKAAAPEGARLLGYVPRPHLPALYGAATVVAYPSIYEGFGLPPVEAMACGAPVVAFRIPPLEESLGEAAVLTAPGDVAELAEALRALVGDDERRAHLVGAGTARAATLSWSATAAKTAALYRSLGVAC
ncbi:MAG TPA: glycosyltransferase family 1 protein [Acidimicrobiales bacterium]|nr:glycosyltransferase family 1 protein [Acidimicrobiales bacterium]